MNKSLKELKDKIKLLSVFFQKEPKQNKEWLIYAKNTKNQTNKKD